MSKKPFQGEKATGLRMLGMARELEQETDEQEEARPGGSEFKDAGGMRSCGIL